MTGMMTMDRGMMGMGMGTATGGMPATPTMPGMPNMGMMMVPRCTMKMEKMAGGMRVTCTCDDKMSAAMLQNLCNMMANGMMGCCCMMNGMMVCQCSMSMGMCKVEMMDMGVVMSCVSGDATGAKMIAACCDCMTAMMMPGCTICMTMNGMPMCCMVC